MYNFTNKLFIKMHNRLDKPCFIVYVCCHKNVNKNLMQMKEP